MPFSFLFLALSAAVAFLLSLLFAPMSASLARHMGAVDIPDSGRHRHAYPTPRLGGLGLLTAFILPLLFALLLGVNGKEASLVFACLIGGLLSAAVGVRDDVCPLSPFGKLFWEMGIACLPLFFGLTLETELPLFGEAVSFFLVLALMNAQNLVDGHDGLSAVLSAVGLSGLSLLLLHAARPTGVLVTLPLLFSVLGFLPFNLPNALLFMGDTGSLTLGYLEGAILLFLVSGGGGDYLFPALLSFFLPLFELVLSVVRRTARGRSPFSADRGHLHHLLSDRGLSKGDVLLSLFSVSLVFMLIGIVKPVFF